MRVAYVRQSPGTSPDQAIGLSHADSLNRVNSRSRAAEGLTNKEIAQRLIVTENTVKTHVTSLFNKLGADSRVRWQWQPTTDSWTGSPRAMTGAPIHPNG